MFVPHTLASSSVHLTPSPPCLSDLDCISISFFFFFNDTATTEIYTLSLHDALPISHRVARRHCHHRHFDRAVGAGGGLRSEEHTSELQSRRDLVCRLLLEKKKRQKNRFATRTTNTSRY